MRLFVAVWPPPEVVERLAGLPRPEIEGLRWTTSEQWHVTLRFLGSVADVEEATARLGRVELPAGPPAVARLGPASTVLGGGPGGGVLAIPVAGLDGVAAAVARAMAGAGRPAGRHGFRGHLTLARGRGGLEGLAGQPIVARWALDRLTLVASDTRPDGAAYRVVADRAVLPGPSGGAIVDG